MPQMCANMRGSKLEKVCEVASATVFAKAVLIACMLSSAAARAEVAVDPTRVVFESRTRNAEVSLINTGDAPVTYRIGFKEVRMTETGKFESLQNPAWSAQDMIRYSPRQVRIAPGQSQTVRLAVRKPADLAPGEYRSHLVMVALPLEGVPGLQAVYGVSIPVIVRHGELSAEVSLSGARLHRSAEGNDPAALEVMLERAGTRSVFGNLQVIYSPAAGGQPRQIGGLRGVAVYANLPRRRVTVPLSEAPRDGSVRVVYREQPRDGGEILAQTQMTR